MPTPEDPSPHAHEWEAYLAEHPGALAATPAADDPRWPAALRARIAQRRAALKSELAAALPSGGQITLEIGSGHGHFLVAYSAAHPDEFCLGCDILGERLQKAERRRERVGKGRCCFIQAEAMELLEELPEGIQLGRVFLLFPDPWPKTRHHKNRLLQPWFLRLLALRGTAGSTRLHFRTDWEPYFHWGDAVVRATPGWSLCEEPWPFECATVFQGRAASHRSLTALWRGGVGE